MAAAATTVTANGTISPKVFWPLVVSVVLTFVATFLSALTPEMLGALGPLAFPMGLALGAVSQVIVAYMKSDELRDLGVQATAAVLPSYDQVTPSYEPTAAPEPQPAPATVVEETPSVSSTRRQSLADEVAGRTGSTAGGSV